jgi:hypothetical protein
MKLSGKISLSLCFHALSLFYIQTSDDTYTMSVFRSLSQLIFYPILRSVRLKKDRLQKYCLLAQLILEYATLVFSIVLVKNRHKRYKKTAENLTGGFKTLVSVADSGAY